MLSENIPDIPDIFLLGYIYIYIFLICLGPEIKMAVSKYGNLNIVPGGYINGLGFLQALN